MSVKFAKEVITEAAVPGGKQAFALDIGKKIGGGQLQAGYLAVRKRRIGHTKCGKWTDAFLQAYINQLQKNPLRTKMLTSGTLAALQEFLASWIAHDRSRHGHYVSSRVPKMAVYGAFISAPLGHVLISLLQKVFAGRTSLKAKIFQILVSNLIVCLSNSHEKHPPRWGGGKGIISHVGVFVLRYLRSKTRFTLPRWPSLPAQGHSTKCELR